MGIAWLQEEAGALLTEVSGARSRLDEERQVAKTAQLQLQVGSIMHCFDAYLQIMLLLLSKEAL